MHSITPTAVGITAESMVAFFDFVSLLCFTGTDGLLIEYDIYQLFLGDIIINAE